ncbi:MAG: single-stranded DNA-binding protein [Elusimicrobia bacterium]|nr:single-stranded DNA-binding protein [Elusimicrobiota bacterium]
MGNLTKDPEKRVTRGDNAVVHFTVACNRGYVDRSTGEKKESVSFVPIVVWGNQAENCAKYLTKGSPVFIEGRLANRSWETSSGERRTRIEVVAQSIQFLRRAPQSGYQAPVESPADDIVKEPPENPSEDEVPF